MKYWVIADTHMDHSMFVEKGYRPENYEEMIIENMRSLGIGVLIHLGDVELGNPRLWHKLITSFADLNWLVLGNHDRGKSNSWFLDRGWDWVGTTFTMKYMGKKILFSHEPKPLNGCDINIHGHFHDSDHRSKEPKYNEVLTDKHYLVALEHTDYRPLLLDNILMGVDKNERTKRRKTEVKEKRQTQRGKEPCNITEKEKPCA